MQKQSKRRWGPSQDHRVGQYGQLGVKQGRKVPKRTIAVGEDTEWASMTNWVSGHAPMGAKGGRGAEGEASGAKP